MRQRTAVLGGAAVVVAAIAAIAWPRSHPTVATDGGGDEGSEAVTERPGAVGGAGLAPVGRTPRPAQAAAASPPPGNPPRAAARHLTLRQDGGRALPPGTTVRVARVEPNRRVVGAPIAVAEDGRVELGARPTSDAMLFVDRPGWSLFSLPFPEAADPATGGATVSLPEATEVRGRVVDPGGAPRPDLVVVATTAATTAWAIYDVVVDTEAFLRHGGTDLARTRTDAEGRFTLHLDADRQYAFAFDDDAWIVDWNDVGSRRLEPRRAKAVELTAIPAVTWRARFVDAGTHADLDDNASVWTQVTRRGGADAFRFGWTSHGANARLTWRRDAPPTEPRDFDVDVSAPAYAPRVVDLRFAAGETRIESEVALSRADAVGAVTVTLEVRDDRGVPFPGPLTVSVRSPGAKGAASWPQLQRAGEGRWTTSLVAGAWELMVRATQPLAALTETTHHLDLRAGEPATVRVSIPTSAPARIRWPWRALPSGWRLTLTSLDGGAGGDEQTHAPGEIGFAAVPVGRYVVRIEPISPAEGGGAEAALTIPTPPLGVPSTPVVVDVPVPVAVPR